MEKFLTISYDDGDSIVFEKLRLTRPDDKGTLVKKFNFTLKKGQRLMLSGPRGCGKSTILRAIAGLWDSGEGKIILPANAKILTVPQKPYLPDLPLRNILCYPALEVEHSDAQMTKALRTVGLGRLAASLDDTEHTGAWWSTRLSLGEQQALIFARILLAKPDVLMIDEISASLDEKSEKMLYAKMLESLPGLTLISISHHKAVEAFHTLHGKIKNRELKISPIRKK